MKWEYKTTKHESGNMFSGRSKSDDLERQLNQLGADGWEFATTLQETSSGTTTILIFKRPKS